LAQGLQNVQKDSRVETNMPITKSAKRAIRGSERKMVFNDRRKKAIKETVKETKALLVTKDKKAVQAMLSKAYKAIDKAVKTKLIKKNTAARKKSRLAKFINKAA
jgi:small subunit ribosomal protein S20